MGIAKSSYPDLHAFWYGVITGGVFFSTFTWAAIMWWNSRKDDEIGPDWWWKAPDFPPDDLQPKGKQRDGGEK